MLSYVEHNKKILTEEGKDWQKVASRLKELESLYSEGSITENLLNDEHTLDAIAALVSSVNQSNISAYIQDYILIINKIILQHSQALNACFRHLAWVMTKYKRSFPKRTFAPL